MTLIVDLGPIVKERAHQLAKLTPGMFWSYYPDRLQISLANVEYATAQTAVTPRIIAQATLLNGSSAIQNQTTQDAKKTTATFRVSMTKGVRHGKQTGFQLPIPKIGTLSGTVTVETTLQQVTEESKSVDQTWQWTYAVPVPPKTRIEVSISIDEALYQPSFDAILQLRGEVGMRKGMVVDGVKQEKFWFYPVGRMFQQFPHAEVTVLGDDAVTMKTTGVFTGIEGLRYTVRTEEFPLDEADEDLQEMLTAQSIAPG